MQTAELVEVLARLIVGAVAGFFAILLWAKSRDSAWMLIIAGTIAYYGFVVYETLKIFGVVATEVYIIDGVLSTGVILENFPPLLFTIGFILMLVRIGRGE
jgi:uncharacterized membrane protein YeaQ/YmgE (transglycosylase-associated protein family)